MPAPQASASLPLIEDHQDIAEMVHACLEHRGCSPDYAADGVTGLHMAIADDCHAIILDLLINEAENGLLSPIGVNCLRRLSLRGIRIRGGRTLPFDPEVR